MPEWRKDPIVDRWVIIATERAKRPFDYKEIVEERKMQECPLCEGNEGMTPPEIIAFREPGTERDKPGWWVRVVPNKFPALRIEGETSFCRSGIYETMNGVGAHEVIVESTDHEPGLDTQTAKQIEEVLWAWRERSLDLRRDTRLKYIQIFKNTGSTAGASLEHTHSQLIAMPLVPAEVREEIERVKEYARTRGSCAFCDMINQELKSQDRVVIDGTHFLSFCPYASRFPFETWIVPKEHQYDFVRIREEQVKELAQVLRSTLRKMTALVKGIPYNMVLHTSPVNMQEEREYHWHLEILPRLTIMAGFELSTGYYINPTPPEMAAQAMRETREVYPYQERPLKGVHQYV
ncbi:MAG: galactose-1-phosphate uridylyltransferase [Firmicutes bacterium]|nr:galactose-1-phosphate uridylyltransferase [Bacillota bacterium]